MTLNRAFFRAIRSGRKACSNLYDLSLITCQKNRICASRSILNTSFSTFRFLQDEITDDGILKKPKVQMPKLSAEEYAKLREQYFAKRNHYRRRTTSNYMISIALIFLSISFASVPVYRAICKRTGWNGTPITDSSKFTSDKMIPVDTDRRIRIQFTAETSRQLPWKFVPQQREVYVAPGETALAFYKAKNKTDHDITGMATYSVAPDNVAPYFNKIQCFCFEEQRLGAHEEVDMPLFFFIDPEFATDPAMRNIEDVVLHYTFFKATHSDDNNILLTDAKDKMGKATKEATKAAKETSV